MRRLLAAATAVLGLALAGSAQADTTWLCRPGLAANPCEIGLDTTVFEPGGTARVERPRPGERAIDCFYVYPTVSNQVGPNATRAKDPELLSIARFQAARFSQHCRVFAPVYRQGTLAALATGGLQDQAKVGAVAYADVLAAWRDYLREDNRGRGVVLIGHSQGTRMLRRLLRDAIEPEPAVRRRLVSALLLGGNVTVRRGEATGGDFREIALCEQAGQLGCVVAYSTFAADPPANTRFGRVRAGDSFGFPSGLVYEVACTDPSRLAQDAGPLRALQPREPYAPGPIGVGTLLSGAELRPAVTTPFLIPPARATGRCATINGAHVLRYEPTPGSRRPTAFPDATWGTHLIDVNLTQEKLVEIVRRQAERYGHPAVTFTRRCRAGRLHLGLSGDLDLVAAVAFKRGRRTLARDVAAPFAHSIRSRSRQRVRAVVTLTIGAPTRMVLARLAPRC